MAWDPEYYVRGNYFQSEVSDVFRKSFTVQPSGTILDIGCGDGQYSRMLADHLKQGSILGIDSSADMIRHANRHWARENLFFEVHDIDVFQRSMVFDFILSFWCLHWTDIEMSFPNIFHSLKNGGRVYAVFSSFSDNSILQTWQELAKQNRYNDLTDRYLNANNTSKEFFFRVLNILNQLPFKQVKLKLKTTRVPMPNSDHFKNLLLTMPFMEAFPEEVVDEFIEATLAEFQAMCQRKYGGTLYYETRPIFLEAIK